MLEVCQRNVSEAFVHCLVQHHLRWSGQSVQTQASPDLSAVTMTDGQRQKRASFVFHFIFKLPRSQSAQMAALTNRHGKEPAHLPQAHLHLSRIHLLSLRQRASPPGLGLNHRCLAGHRVHVHLINHTNQPATLQHESAQQVQLNEAQAHHTSQQPAAWVPGLQNAQHSTGDTPLWM